MTDSNGKNTGGPAFPLHNHGTQTLGMHLSGMTLRDYFAAKAMQGQLSRPNASYLEEEQVAKVAYMQADAMLEARK